MAKEHIEAALYSMMLYELLDADSLLLLIVALRSTRDSTLRLKYMICEVTLSFHNIIRNGLQCALVFGKTLPLWYMCGDIVVVNHLSGTEHFWSSCRDRSSTVVCAINPSTTSRFAAPADPWGDATAPRRRGRGGPPDRWSRGLSLVQLTPG